MTGALAGTAALVMGASRGIGAATARALARDGADVTLVARDAQKLAAVAADIAGAGGAAGVHVADLAEADAAQRAIEATLARCGRLDCLINNAASIAPVARLTEADPRAWMRGLDLTLGASFRNCRAALAHFGRVGAGVIVHLSSGAAHRPLEGWSAYCVGKAASLMLMRSIALEKDAGIRVYSLQPGAVDTDMLGEVRASGLSEFAARPRETLIPAEWPARLIAWLCRERPDDLDGQELTIRDPALRRRAGLPEGDYT
ncbi:MAG: SDR family oxidoreductase [Methylobacteriaceae bacterium]|nr:SDR family oxidoreductase [Methylobacteriaceae bacterium]